MVLDPPTEHARSVSQSPAAHVTVRTAARARATAAIRRTAAAGRRRGGLPAGPVVPAMAVGAPRVRDHNHRCGSHYPRREGDDHWGRRHDRQRRRDDHWGWGTGDSDHDRGPGGGGLGDRERGAPHHCHEGEDAEQTRVTGLHGIPFWSIRGSTHTGTASGQGRAALSVRLTNSTRRLLGSYGCSGS